jgi:hypothetical protein
MSPTPSPPIVAAHGRTATPDAVDVPSGGAGHNRVNVGSEERSALAAGRNRGAHVTTWDELGNKARQIAKASAPEHLVLGRDALELAAGSHRALEEEIVVWESLSRSIDFPNGQRLT